MTVSSEQQPSSHEIKVLSDQGSGRTFITIVDDEAYLPFATAVVEKLASKARSVLLMSSAVTATTWQPLSEAFSGKLTELNVRQASIVGMGAGATLAQNVALNQPKIVRTLAIVDSSSRPHPTRWERIVDWIEEHLPFGLPLRLGSTGFNVKAYLHRVRCPVLVIATGRASSFIREEIKSLALRAPTAWRVMLSGPVERQIAELSEALINFQDTPAKCPQKNAKDS
jgi:pimeloyl-ACP methyl ester carboxylesterase